MRQIKKNKGILLYQITPSYDIIIKLMRFDFFILPILEARAEIQFVCLLGDLKPRKKCF